MIKSINGGVNFKTFFEKDKNYFFRKDDKGRHFFHYYCIFKSGYNFVKEKRQLIKFGVNLKLKGSEGKGPLFYIIENDNQIVSKGMLLYDYERSYRLSSSSAIQLCVDTVQLCFDYSQNLNLLFDLNRHLKLCIIQILLGDYSENTIFSILEEYDLRGTTYYSKLTKDYWVRIKKFYFFSNFKMDGFKTDYDFSQSQISAINEENIEERWSKNGNAFNQTVKGGRYNCEEVELRTFTVLMTSGVPNIYEEIANYRLGKIPPYRIIGYYHHNDCFTLVLRKI
ncbi:hypothetical protein ACTFIY_010521 [Dictyostelium cf. discoideum]